MVFPPGVTDRERAALRRLFAWPVTGTALAVAITLTLASVVPLVTALVAAAERAHAAGTLSAVDLELLWGRSTARRQRSARAAPGRRPREPMLGQATSSRRSSVRSTRVMVR
ncbi:hypothetical protein GRQ65_18360 [Nocardioides sp. YIM 123512]|uniref:Uncharacterized protein n=1 Tax=Nocardioides flavescens TaxID=2691959 RepID=A0A6L7EVU2_9ACTN|nr:DUF6611 family protein [Nocardioides flavescens]MXG91513.1 hypothetical protein [Nocardioides flavescens]